MNDMWQAVVDILCYVFIVMFYVQTVDRTHWFTFGTAPHVGIIGNTY
jgi:hypothetical protein